jgi:cell wall-associated NlpC family hydrolase
MSFVRTFPRLLAVCLSVASFAAAASAQEASRPRQAAASTQATAAATGADGRARLETDVVLVSEAEGEAEEAAEEFRIPSIAPLRGVERVMLSAIEARLGTPYRLGTEGPTRYDCSGFVWSVFREAGFDFERGSARSFWSEFEPAGEDEKFKFGTLVFFNHLGHVGIVADENGFYHASTSKGVVYSRFNDYWTRRITGFRRVPAGHTFIASAGR